MKIATHISPTAAARDNGPKVGLVVAEIDLAAWTPEERAELAAQAYSTERIPGDCAAVSGYSFGILDADHLRRHISSRIAAKQKEAQRLAECQEIERTKARAEIANGNIPSVNYAPDIREWPEYQALRRAKEAKDSAQIKAQQSEYEAKCAAREAAKQEALQAQAKWIKARGSERLRRCLQEGIECSAAYRDERLDAERPGWAWDTIGADGEARNPPEAAFGLLDSARQSAPDAKLGHLTIEAGADEDGYETLEEWRGYVCKAEFLGRPIAYGLPS